LAVIPGRGGDHAALLLWREAADQVQPAAHLERARRVVILVLDEKVEAGFGGEQRVPHERRRANDAVHPFARGVDVGQSRSLHDLSSA